MLKTQRQNLIMENEFHIKEERVKAQQSSAKTQDAKDTSHNSGKATPKLPVAQEAAAKKEPDNVSSGSKKTSNGEGEKPVKDKAPGRMYNIAPIKCIIVEVPPSVNCLCL